MEAISLNESNFILNALSTCEKRIDGRGLFDYRNLRFHFYDQPGKIELALGDTLILVNTTAELSVPYSNRPFEGFLDFSVEFLPMAHDKFEHVIGFNIKNIKNWRRNGVCNEIERMLENTIKRAKAINPESLCLIHNLHAWRLSISTKIL